MHLSLLLAFLFFSLALGSPSDVLYIKKLIADESQVLDDKHFAGLVEIFTKNATYKIRGGLSLYGIDSIQANLAKAAPPEVISSGAVSTESITLLPPFDEQGAAGTATGVVYLNLNYIGQGDLAGQALTLFIKYKDKYVKTEYLAPYGGWRIEERLAILFVSYSKVH